MHPVAEKLTAKSSDKPVDGELGTIFGRLRSEDLDLSLFLPLTSLIVDKAQDTEIWKAVIDLIKHFTGPKDVTTPFEGECLVNVSNSRPTKSCLGKTEIIVNAQRYLICLREWPYFKSWSDFNEKTGQNEMIVHREEIPYFDVVFNGWTNGIRHCFDLSGDIKAYRQVCQTMHYLGLIDSISNEGLRNICRQLRYCKDHYISQWEPKIHYDPDVGVQPGDKSFWREYSYLERANVPRAHNAAFKLIYFLLAESCMSKEDTKLASKATKYILSQPLLFHGHMRDTIEKAFECRLAQDEDQWRDLIET